MIGRKKLYKAGLADGIQISEAISKKQEEAIAYVREEVRSGNQLGSAMSEAIASLGDNIAGLYKYLNSKEKAALYHLNTPIDIKELGEYEKHLLVAMLIELSNDESSSITENQRTYTRAIMQYLEIKNPDLTAQSVPLSNRINSIDSINVQKTFLRVALEFFYLQDNDELSDTQEDFLDCFPLKKETAAEIKSEVSRLFSAVGAEGIAEKYGYIPLEEPEIAEQSEIPCESDEETHVSRTEPEIGVGLDISNLEEITLSGIIHIDQGEACTYKNKIIHFQASMECEGTLEFDTCIIHYGEIPGSGQIVMTKTSSLSVCQCTVENHSCGERMFIDADRIQTGIAFTNSEFLNCCFFLRTQDELALTHCKLSNPGKDFVIACNCLDKKETVITDCDFLFLDTPAFLYDCRDRLHDQHIICCDILRLSSCYVKGNLQLNSPEDCQNTEDRCEPPFLFAAAEISILSSSFFGLQNIAQSGKIGSSSNISISLSTFTCCKNINYPHAGVTEIKECRFDKCSSIGNELSPGSQIQDCQFNNCFCNLFSTDYEGGVTIKFCEFNNWCALKSSEEDFLLIDPDFMMLQFRRIKGGEKSILEKCIFNGINAHKSLLLHGYIHEKINSYVVSVTQCSFANCLTEREDKCLICESGHYYGFRDKRYDVKTVDISNCTGLDQVNTGTGYNEHVTLKTHTNGGIKIGVPDR